MGVSTDKIPYQVPVPVYVDYRSHRVLPDLKVAVERMLAGVPRGYLAGLGHVALRDSGSLTRRERAKRRKAGPGKALLGTYYSSTPSAPAHIDLFVDAIVDNWPNLLLRIPFFRDVRLAPVLFHELGHHIGKVVRPESRGRERVAEDWKRELSRHYFRKRYWYLLPLLSPVAMLLRRRKRRTES